MMRRWSGFLIVILWIAPAWAVTDNQEAICDQSWVIFCDNFNVRATGLGDLSRATYKNRGWQYFSLVSNGGTNSVASIVDPTGATSSVLQQECSGYNGGYNVCASYLSSYFTRSVPEVYFRWYAKWSSNYVWSTGQKFAGLYYNSPSLAGLNIGNQSNCAPPQFLFYFNVGIIPSGTLCTASGSPGTFGSYVLKQTLNEPAVVWNATGSQWYCIEAHVKLNNPGTAANGTAELWINNVLTISRSDLNIVANLSEVTNRNIDQLNFYARWECGNGEQADGGCYTEPRYSHPIQQRWIDNVVVGTQRVGCLGATPPPSDTSAPAAPGNLRVSSLLWDQFLKGFWALAGLLG
jgi:hypothetical protein